MIPRARKAHPIKEPRRNPLLRKAANAFRKAHEHQERAEAIFKAAEPARTSTVEPATTGKSISVPEETLREIRKRLVTTRAVVVSCAHALATFSDTDDIQLTMEDDVVSKLNCLDVALRLILSNQPFDFCRKDAKEEEGRS